MYFFCDILIFIFVTLFLISWYFYILMMIKSWPKQSTLLYDFKYIDFCLKHVRFVRVASSNMLQHASITAPTHSIKHVGIRIIIGTYYYTHVGACDANKPRHGYILFFFTFNLLIFNLILQCLIWFLTRAQTPRVRHTRRGIMSWRIRKSRITPEMTPLLRGDIKYYSDKFLQFDKLYFILISKLLT